MSAGADRPRRRRPSIPTVVLVAVVLLGATGCAGDGEGSASSSRTVMPAGAGDQATLSGVGSTFVEPLLRQWIERYRALVPGVAVDYEAIGSPAALRRFENGEEGLFFASDVPLTEAEEVILGGSDEFVQVPWAAGAIAIAYNLPDVDELHLSPDTVAAVFAGRIVRWDDPSIRADNPGVPLPGLGIQVVYRADSSGTTSVFTSYLDAAAGGSWGLRTGPDVAFPRGQGVRGSEGVAAAVRRTAGAIGYVQVGLAREASLGVALLGNRAGRFVAPTPEAVNAALSGATARRFGTSARLLFTPDAPGAYPLSTFSYLLFRPDALAPEAAGALRRFATWALTEGQRFAEPLGYAVVPRQFQIPAIEALVPD